MKRPEKRPLHVCLFVASVALVLPLGCRTGGGSAPDPETLPIFKLAPATVDASRAAKLGGAFFGIAGDVERRRDAFTLRSGEKLVEVCAKSGGVWAADRAELWNPRATPELPPESQARQIADAFVRQHGLLPQAGAAQPIDVAFASIGGTWVARFDAAARSRTQRQIDRQVTYTTRVAVGQPGVDRVLYPIVGGGGEMSVTVGDGGRVVAYSGVWRPITGVDRRARLIPKAETDTRFRELTKSLRLRSMDSYLAYYSAPMLRAQTHLYPVRVYRAVAQMGEETVPLRLVLLPATDFGPKLVIRPPDRGRTAGDRPKNRSTDPEGRQERGGQGGGDGREERQYSFAPRTLAPQSGWKEAGTSFIGTSGGLPGSAGNAGGFVDELSSDGWTVNFRWGDDNAWESDWNRNDDSWLDAADFVFYTGHANRNGWQLRNPDDGWLGNGEVGSTSPADMWGGQDLEWVIVAACGPLQDEVIGSGGGDVFDRWRGAFDGLHQLLGYGGITFDNEEEGERVVRYARDGESVIQAWFRAAREIQPSTNGASAPDGPDIWVGVMYPLQPGTDVGSDRIWGHGSVSSDPTAPTGFLAMWTRT